MKQTYFKDHINLLETIKKIIKRKGLLSFIFFYVKLFFFRCKKYIFEKGLNYTIQSLIRVILNYDVFSTWLNNNDKFWTWFYINFKTTRTFKFNGRKYNYFYHRNWITWDNERSVEIPIILEIVKKYKGKNILKVGNVLMNFFVFDRDIVDKYEKSKGVLNEDVIDYNPNKKYDIIITISTVEHVGWDEQPREPLKIYKAIDNLKRLLVPGGKIIITLPKGHNPVLDNLLRENKIPFTERYFLKRVSKNNRWKQVPWKKISNVKYGSYVRWSASAVIIGYIHKKINN